MKILDKNSITELLSDKSLIGEGATSYVYKVNNFILHKGFLSLKILKDAVIKKKYH